MKNFIVCALTFVLVVLGMSATTVSAAELPYEISPETVYYESAYGFGSGRRGIVNDENPYATTPCEAAINGYAFINESGKILDSAYEETETDIYIPEAPEGTAETFVHFRTLSYRNGWCDAEAVIGYQEEQPSKKSEATPEEVAAEIKKEIEQEKTALVIDYSGSMSDNQEQVIELLKTFELEDTPIIVFADEYQMITAEQLQTEDFDVGGGTEMLPALNAANRLGEIHTLIIISDLETYDLLKNELITSSTLSFVKIFDPDETEFYDAEVMELLESTWGGVPIERVRIK